ncbi:MAG: DNA-processing protein DprA [Erysipelotrichaceae bacterium]|nr:DNA-processing protein DprA [Erysipelotrichaceae bacterium]MDD3923592.1 DNA-processing protein DprA [Erysipelotrichaceae bacterium]MDD4642304.1 DNA-processing protein DprA [Erysipelotrichaceae bacterium]
MDNEKLLSYALYYGGDYKRIYRAIKINETIKTIAYHGKYLTINDPLYPDEFNMLRFPPLVLFYKGNINLLAKEKIAVVGSRDHSDYGRSITCDIVEHLAKRYVIVSGMAKGIDRIAHLSAIKIGHTIGVLGCGIDHIYPQENYDLYELMGKRDLLLSEYPYNVKPMRHHFPFRNRMIAALGKNLIVTQANSRSGTMLTVNEALELNKDVYVVPYPLTQVESGCNQLIKQGANIITCMEDIENI